MNQLKRIVNLPLLTFYGIGNTLGAGIYVLVGKVAGYAGMFTPLAFMIATMVAAFTAFSYAELSARYPVSAGEAVYIYQATGQRWLALSIGLLLALAGVVSAATISLGFVGYLQVFVSAPAWLTIIMLIMVLGAVAVWGISQSVVMASVFTIVELFGLLLIIIMGGDKLLDIPERWPELLPSMDTHLWLGIMMGAFLAFYAFLGFEDMVNVAEEVKDPQRLMPQGIFLALAISSVLYLLVALVSVLAVTPEQLRQSGAPLALVYERTTGRTPMFISLISLFAIVNGALVQIIMSSRVLYGMSSQGWLPAVLARVHPRTQTPVIATVLVCVVLVSLALWFPLEGLARATSGMLLLIFTLVNLSLCIIKIRHPSPLGVRTYPYWVPVTALLLSVGLVSMELLFW